MVDTELDKLCLVCGHKALGNNFGARSCESCKSFFRRNAFRNNLKCNFTNNCQIDVITRRFCSKCRLDKCFAMGLKKEWINNRNAKIVDKNQTLDPNGSESYHSLSQSSDTMISDNCDDYLWELLDDTNNSTFDVDILNKQIIDIENSLPKNSTTSNNMIRDKQNTIQQIGGHKLLAINGQQNHVRDEIIRKVAEFELSMIPIFGRPIGESKCQLNLQETHLIGQVMQSTKLMGLPVTKNLMTISNIYDYFCTIVTKFDQAIRNTTNAAKQLQSFRNVCDQDQLTLLKYGCIQIIFMRSILYFNCPEDSITLPMDQENTMLIDLNNFKSYNYNYYQAYKNYIQNMLPMWQSDRVIIDLMFSIILFNPDHPNLVDPDAIKGQQHMYLYLLKRYLLIKYQSQYESVSRLLKLMNIIMDLNILRQYKRNVMQTLRETPVTPLLREVLDITG